jgi:hypothetical protein
MFNRSLMILGIASLALTSACGDSAGDDSGGDSSNTTTTTTTSDTDNDADTGDSSSGSDTTGTESGGNFVPDMPGGPAMCDPLPYNDCEDGQKCTWNNDGVNGDQNICVEVMGDAQAGDECMNIGNTDTCDVHKICWGADPDTGLGVCIEFCDENQGCPENAPCTITNNGTLPMCLPPCHPLEDDCPTGWACYDDPSLAWFCDRDVSGDAGQHGTGCQFINACDPGSICVDAAAVNSTECQGGTVSGCCANVCAISEGAACPNAMEECTSYYSGMTPPPGYEDVGICIMPA